MFKLYTLAGMSLYFLLISFTYANFLSPLFAYSGLIFELNIYKFTLSIFIIFLSAFTIVNDFKSNYLILIQVLILIPSLTVFSVGGGSYEFILNTTLGYIFVFASSKIKVNNLKFVNFNKKSLLTTLTLMSLVFLASIFLQGGYKYINFNILAVYDFRNEASENLSGVFGYLSPIFGKVVIPVVIVLALIERHRAYLFIGVIMSVLLFALTSHKSPLIYPVIIIFIYLVFDKFEKFKLVIILTFILICLIAMFDLHQMLSSEDGFGLFGSFIFRRSLILPSYINYLHIDFFINREFIFWANSKLTLGLIESPYETSAAYLIGNEYYGNSDAGANTGWIGSGFANAGWLGVIIYSFILGILISFFNAVAKKVGESEVFSLSFISFLTLILSTDLTTALLTHGLIGLILILTIYPRQKN